MNAKQLWYTIYDNLMSQECELFGKINELSRRPLTESELFDWNWYNARMSQLGVIIKLMQNLKEGVE